MPRLAKLGITMPAAASSSNWLRLSSNTLDRLIADQLDDFGA